MPKEEAIVQEGVVTEVLRNAIFRVKLESGLMVLARTSGKMTRHHIKIVSGDRVKLEISPYDITKGRIVYRYK